MNDLPSISKVTLILIGNNLGPRLSDTLDAALDTGLQVIYVDSFSGDKSLEIARSKPVTTLQVDAGRSKTAAEARNEGLRYVLERMPNASYIATIDGDCRLVKNFLQQAINKFTGDPKLGAITGIRREETPDKNFYHRICEAEWDKTVGEIAATGGDAIFCRQAFEKAGLFRADLIAGEEFELCERIRAAGFKVERIETTITYHDCGINSIGPYLKRSLRAGASYAYGLQTYHNKAVPLKKAISATVYGFLIPMVIAFASGTANNVILLISFVYLIPIVRTYVNKKKVTSKKNAMIWAIHCSICKPFEFLGFLFCALKLSNILNSLSSYRKSSKGT